MGSVYGAEREVLREIAELRAFRLRALSLAQGSVRMVHLEMAPFALRSQIATSNLKARREGPKRDIAVESHLCAENAQRWGTRLLCQNQPY